MKVKRKEKKSIRSKMEFYSKVFWSLNNSTRVVIYALIGIIISATLICITRDIMQTALILVIAIASVVCLKFLLEMFSGVFEDIRSTADFLRRYPPKKDYSKESGYKRLMQVLKSAGENDIAYQLSKAVYWFDFSGRYFTPKNCDYQFEVGYPPYVNKWEIIIHDKEQGVDRVYTE